jgi:DNA-directed RNA polymerase specialized sigma24 family protein
VNSADEPISVKDLENLCGELRAMARRLLFTERRSHSVTPTALAMTALRRAKLHDQEWENVRWENRAHFFGALMMAMRHALIDRARAAGAQKKPKMDYLPGNDPIIVNYMSDGAKRPDSYIALDEALCRLKKIDPESALIIEQRYYADFAIKDMAAFMEVDEKTVDRRLKRARVLLGKLIDEVRETS